MFEEPEQSGSFYLPSQLKMKKAIVIKTVFLHP
jgi:hypothetical protein